MITTHVMCDGAFDCTRHSMQDSLVFFLEQSTLNMLAVNVFCTDHFEGLKLWRSGRTFQRMSASQPPSLRSASFAFSHETAISPSPLAMAMRSMQPGIDSGMSSLMSLVLGPSLHQTLQCSMLVPNPPGSCTTGIIPESICT